MGKKSEFVKGYFRWEAWEKLFISFEFLLVAILGFILYSDFQRRLDAGEREEIGIITFKQNTVQRRYSDRAVWESMGSSFPLYNKDSVRTGDESDAEISLNDGTKLEVDENTLIVLNISKQSKEINFAYGSITASSQGGEVEGVLIRSGDNSVDIKDGKVNLTQNNDSSLVVDVKEGLANLFSGGEEKKISSNEKVSIQGDVTEVVTKPFRVINPPSSYRAIFSGDWVNLEYKLEGFDNKKPAVLEFSRTRNFKNVFYKRSIPSSSFTEPFKPGVYYWRAVQGGNVASSGKVNLIQVSPSRLISPNQNSKIHIQSDKSLVSFSWTPEEGIGQYVLELSQSEDFSDIYLSKNTLGNSSAMEIPTGKYLWRVKSLLSGDAVPVYSNIGNFQVTKESVATPPGLLHPKRGDSFSSKIIQETGIGFFWTNVSGYDSYELEISRRSDFSDPITIRSSANNSKYMGALSSGDYYWRVRGVTISGDKGNYSSFSNFSISELDKNIFNLQSDSQVSEAMVGSEGVTLKWRKLPINGTYEVLLAKDKDFNQVVKKVVTNLNQVKIQELVKGKYFWKVSLIDEKGDAKLVSDYKTIEVSDLFGPIFPKTGTRVNMTERNELLFEWDLRLGIDNYTIIIYDTKSGNRNTILQKSTSTNRFILNELDILDEGKFEWEIYYNEKGERKKEFQSDFYIALDPLPEKIELLTPKIQYAD